MAAAPERAREERRVTPGHGASPSGTETFGGITPRGGSNVHTLLSPATQPRFPDHILSNPFKSTSQGTSTLVRAIQDGKHGGTNQVEQVAGVVPGTLAINGSLHHDGAGAVWHRSLGPDLLPPHDTGQRVATERHSLPWAPAAISLTSNV